MFLFLNSRKCFLMKTINYFKLKLFSRILWTLLRIFSDYKRSMNPWLGDTVIVNTFSINVGLLRIIWINWLIMWTNWTTTFDWWHFKKREKEIALPLNFLKSSIKIVLVCQFMSIYSKRAASYFLLQNDSLFVLRPFGIL